MIGKALLPVSTTARASLPAPVETSTDTAPAPVAEKVESVPEAPLKEPLTPEAPQATEATVLKAETAAEPPQEVNSVPEAEVKAESVPAIPRSLSPYPYVSLDPFHPCFILTVQISTLPLNQRLSARIHHILQIICEASILTGPRT